MIMYIYITEVLVKNQVGLPIVKPLIKITKLEKEDVSRMGNMVISLNFIEYGY